MSQKNYNFSNIPNELKQTNHWVLWRNEERNGKKTKVPYQADGSMAQSNNRRTWSSFHSVANTYTKGNYDGIGFMFSKEDPFIGIDIDKSVADGKLSDFAEEIVEMMDSYTEYSPSGKGLHIIVKGELPIEKGTGKKSTKHNLEVYRHGRYFTFTGNSFNVPEIVERTDELGLLFKKYFSEEENKARTTKKTFKNTNSNLSNAELWEKMFNSKNGAAIQALSNGELINGDHSSTDLALANHLAFWTNKDAFQMDSMFRESSLFREKWDKQHSSDGRTYGEMTLESAIKSTHTTRADFSKNDYSVVISQGERTSDSEQKVFARTDYGNAERLVYKHGKNLRYCPPFSSWFIWNGKRWIHDLRNQVETLAKETVRDLARSALEIEDFQTKKLYIDHAMRSESYSKITSMINMAKSEPGIAILPNDLDSDKWKLNCENGTIDLKTGKLLPHNREHLITKIVPVDYDPNTICPTWMNFLKSIMKKENGEPNLELMEYLQRIIGYSLTGDTAEQVMFFLYGSGRNGKSTFINIIKDLLGDYASQANTETFMLRSSERINNDIAALKGARLVSAVEIEKGKSLAESLIKQLTGGETIQARFMHKDFFEYLPQFKIFLTTNHMPNIGGTDTGIWRRIRLIPFTVTIDESEKDKNLPEKLQAELPGILRWAVEGCLKWQKYGLGFPKEVRKATNLYKTEQDSLEGFVTECCTINSEHKVMTKTLYHTYEYWCRDNGETPLSKKIFLSSLKEKFSAEGHLFVQVRIGSKGDRGYQGISITDNHLSVQSAFKI